jgi:hypothetical protein
MDRFAAGTPQATQENCFDKGNKIGEDKTVPPQGLVALRATGRLLPGKIFTKAGNFIDVGCNRKYQ